MTDPDDAYLPPEARARIKIDRQLKNAGWVVQHVHQVNLTAGSGVAVREFVLEPGHGRVDYLLFVDGQPAGVIEAKPEGTTLIEVEHQSGKYMVASDSRCKCATGVGSLGSYQLTKEDPRPWLSEYRPPRPSALRFMSCSSPAGSC